MLYLNKVTKLRQDKSSKKKKKKASAVDNGLNAVLGATLPRNKIRRTWRKVGGEVWSLSQPFPMAHRAGWKKLAWKEEIASSKQEEPEKWRVMTKVPGVSF